MRKNITDRKIYSIESAMKAHKDGKLHEWVQQYLLDEGNDGLAKAFREEKAITVEIVKFPLSLLQKIDGPEEHHLRQPLDVWEERVSHLEVIVRNDESLPPLIATDFWKPLEIVDGNHRHEALKRNGITEFWTIFYLRNQENTELINKYKAPVASQDQM